MSPQQKCARPTEGCHEHSFTLQSIIADCKRNQKNCFLAWLDLRNAFGSISHESIYTSLSHMGYPDTLINLIKNFYTNSTTIVRTSQKKQTRQIPILSGVKQGCPLRPILFNLTSELLIRSVTTFTSANPRVPFMLHKEPISLLAYADDLVLIRSSSDGLQNILNEISSPANILNLTFRPDKCATLSLTCQKNELTRVGNNTFYVQNCEVPCLQHEETYRYLGVPMGFIYNPDEMESITDKLIQDMYKIRVSQLAPWLKLDALKTFIQPCLTYALRTCPVTRASLESYRSNLIKTLRSIFHLLQRATTSYFLAERSAGGLGFFDPFKE